MSMSTFGIFPIIATYGEGYFQRGNGGVNPFGKYLPKSLSNVREMQGRTLSSGKIFQMGVQATLDWFVSSDSTMI